MQNRILCRLQAGMGLGNQLWQIASTHGIADSIGADHGVIGLQDFKAAHFLELSPSSYQLTTHESNQFQYIYEKQFYDPNINFNFNLFDKSLYNHKPRNSIISGLLQDERYLSSNLPFSYNGRNFDFDFGNALICNVRGGEYRLHKKFQLTKKYWEINIEYFVRKYSISTIIAVTDDVAYCNKLDLFDKIISGSVEKCFAALMAANYVAASNSTFSYFPLKLNHKLVEATLPMFYNRPYNRGKIWASPQNFYRKYTYVSPHGDEATFQELLPTVRSLEKQYRENPIYQRPPSRHTFYFLLKQIVPSVVKQFLKKCLYKFYGK